MLYNDWHKYSFGEFHSNKNSLIKWSVLGSDSDTDEWSNKYNRHIDSSLTGTIRELISIDDSDDTDTRFQSLRDNYNLQQPSIEGYRLANTQNIIVPPSVSNFDEVLIERQKRDVSTWGFDSPQAFIMDGSGTTEEESKCLLFWHNISSVEDKFFVSLSTLSLVLEFKTYFKIFFCDYV